MGSAADILSERFLIDLVSVDRIGMLMQIPNGHAHPLERSVSLRVTAIEKNNKPDLPLREVVYDLDFMNVSGFRMELPNIMEESTLDMDVDDVSFHERPNGISTIQFQNGHASIEIDFREVVRKEVTSKECAR